MICSSSSSSRPLARRAAPRIAGLAAAFVAVFAACGHAKPLPEPSAGPPLHRIAVSRIAVFPVQNATGGPAPIRPLSDALDAAIAARGISVVPRRDLDAVLAQHRIRFTGGVDRPLAKVFREELGVGAVLVPTLEQYAPDKPPKVAITMRLVSADDRPVVLWADGVARSGDDSPGLLARGIMTTSAEVEKAVVTRLARALEEHLDAGAEGSYCGGAGRFKPTRKFRAPVLDDVGRRTIAVLPFRNQSGRRAANDVLFSQFVAQLARSGSFEVLDPGLVREELLGHRIVLEGGVSLDNAIAMLDLLQADLVVSGYVEVFETRAGTGPPKVEFNAFVLDRRTRELVWSSASSGAGEDGVWFFGVGRVHTAAALSCRMVRGVVDAIVGDRPPLGPPG